MGEKDPFFLAIDMEILSLAVSPMAGLSEQLH